MLVLFIIAMGATLLVQAYLRSTYSRWQNRPAASGLSGAQTAQTILSANGITDVGVEEVKGVLTDHYDPIKKVVRLSTVNFRGSSVAAHAVAAHEVGHALQHAQAYGPLKMRSALLPVANIGANFAPWLIILGFFLSMSGMVTVGIVLFGAAVLFQLVTLPVEYDASKRAGQQLEALGIATTGEVAGTKQVLNAAALTYVAAAATSVMYLLYYISMFMGNRD
ncbi:MAG: zinc metallopeptidase [Trueperaceae bacterium]|nr:zinc metallopeptidase [Trueperaceae bacterium]